MKVILYIAFLAALPLSTLADYYNPCGIIQGGYAWFRIDFGRVSPPDSEITWHQSGTGAVSFPNGNTGKIVCVSGETCGDVKIEVQIGDARSPRPRFPAKVVTNSVLGVSAWVISGADGPAMTYDQVEQKFAKANEIWKQAGVEFHLDDFVVTNKPDMLEIGYTSTNNLPTVYDLTAINPAVGVLKVYFVNVIHGASTNGVVNGTTTRQGIVISANARMNTLAHEIGHALGLKDVYVVHQYAPAGMCVSGPVSEEKMPDDWNGGTGQRYYRPGTRIESLIPKLLMYGNGVDDKADITIGDVYGLWYSNRWNVATHSFTREWQTSLAPIGFFTHGSAIPTMGNEETNEENEMGTITNMVAVISTAGTMATDAIRPSQERLADEEQAFQSLSAFSRFDHHEETVATYEAAFEDVGRDKERMTRVLIRLAQEAIARFKGIDDNWSSQDSIECNIDLWWSAAKSSIGSLGEYGTKTAIPFLESVLTNDVCGASDRAMDAYVKLAWDDGRAFDFIRQNFGEGKKLPLETGRAIYLTLKHKLADKGLPADARKGYIDYLHKRAKCETSSVTGSVLDSILVEHVPGYRDSEERKANLKVIKWPNPNIPHFHFKRRKEPPGLSYAESRKWQKEEDKRLREEAMRYEEAVKKYK